MWQQELDTCMQGTEKVEQYVCRLHELMRKVDPIDDYSAFSKISMFMRGLNPKYKFHVRAANPVTLERAVEVAKAYELSYDELAQQQVGIIQTPANNQITSLLNQMQTQLEVLQMNTQSNNPQNQNQRNNSSNNNSSNFNNSNQSNNRAGRNRNNNRGNNRNNRSSDNCFCCGKPGHFASDCWHNPNHRNNNQQQNGNQYQQNNSRYQQNDNHNYNQEWRNNQSRNQQYNQGDFDLATLVRDIVREEKHLKD
jgi:ATP-dependent Clp protease ATP-binding subunit ClpA